MIRTSAFLLGEITMRIIRLTLIPGLVLSYLVLPFHSAGEGQVMSKSSLTKRERIGTAPAGGLRIAPPSEEFVVWMPETPTQEIKHIVVDQRRTTINCYSVTKKGTTFAVLTLTGLDTGRKDLAHMLMLNLYSEVIGGSTARSQQIGRDLIATYEGDISLAGYSGREFRLQDRERTGLWHVYTKGERFYAVAALTDDQDTEPANYFLESFSLGSASTVAKTVERAPRQPTLSTTRTEQSPSRSTGTWFVILRTLSKSERTKASQTMLMMKSFGHEAKILDTDHYPNLKNGFLVVALGPYSKTEAQNLLNKVRGVAPESYLKSGW